MGRVPIIALLGNVDKDELHARTYVVLSDWRIYSRIGTGGVALCAFDRTRATNQSNPSPTPTVHHRSPPAAVRGTARRTSADTPM